MLDFMSTAEAANLWNINERRVRFLAQHGRIPGAYISGKKWLIPKTASKPIDKRVSSLEDRVCYIHDNEYGDGVFGDFGGIYLPHDFEAIFKPILEEYKKMFNSSSFVSKLQNIRKELQFRPTPLYFAEKFSNYLGNVQLYVKREDMNYCGSIYMNQTVPMAYLAKELNKKKILTECGDANYALALAYAGRLVDIPVEIYVGYQDYLKQKSAYDQLFLLGARYLLITEGNQGLYDATNAAFRRFLLNEEELFYCFHDAIGPHPFPTLVEKLQSTVGKEAKAQFNSMLDKDPEYVIAPAGVASNSLGIFKEFYETKAKLIISESGGLKEQKNPNSVCKNGELSRAHGFTSISLIDEKTGDCNVECECGGMSYPSLSPKIADLLKKGRVKAVEVSDEDAVKAVLSFSKNEGIMPSLEDGYTLAAVISLSQRIKNATILVCLTGNGSKDVNYIYSKYKGLI